ncbi:MAG: DUF4860 domain-containing protein [Coriobacteriales bacterium]|jgi:hypothetical protein|nr:DUF4860 domain-containing protein [Coriobacteriales bacterium]
MRRHQADVFVVLALFSVYAALALLLCAFGAGIYREASNIMQANYDQRTSSLYVAEKVRQSDSNGAITVRQLDGADALVLIDQTSGQFYETWIYVHDGMLCEALILSGADVNYQLGQTIMPLESMRATQSSQGVGSLLELEFTLPDGSLSSIALSLKSQSPAALQFLQETEWTPVTQAGAQ